MFYLRYIISKNKLEIINELFFIFIFFKFKSIFFFRATPTGVAIRGVIPITAKIAPKSQKGSNGDGIKGSKMSSVVLGCHIWKL